MTTGEHPSTDLREYLRIFASKKYQIAAVTLGVMAVALFFSFRQTPIFVSQAKVFVEPLDDPSTAAGGERAPNLDTERELILSLAVASSVQEELELDTSADQLLRHVGVQVIRDTEILVIKYESPTPRVAARLANGFAQAYVEFRKQRALGHFQTAIEAVEGQIEADQAEVAALTRQINETDDEELKDSLTSQKNALIVQVGVLQQRLIDLQSTAAAAADSSAQIVQPAEVSRSPARPNELRDGLIGLVVGLVLGVAIAYVRERLDDRIKSRLEVERRLGAPIIAAVPKISGWRKPEDAVVIMLNESKSPVSEAYRTLGTNVLYLASQEPIKTLMITSALEGEGKSTTAANLAVALAEAQRRVILVSADLRRPRLHQFFGLSNKLGMTDILSDSIPLAQVVEDPGIENLRVVNGGSIPQNPARLLRSARAVEFIEALTDLSDFVIVDTPPLLPVADALILAPMMDAVIYVMDAERSSRSAIAQARHQLENAGARLAGAVYNNFDPSQSRAYPYLYYSYYARYYDSDDGSRNGHRRKVRRRSRRREPAGEAPEPVSRVEQT